MSIAPPDSDSFCASSPVDHAQTPAHCSRCDAVCCRLTVVVMPEDRVPGHLLEDRDGTIWYGVFSFALAGSVSMR